MSPHENRDGSRVTDDADDPESVVGRYLAALNHGDPAAVVAEVSEDFVNEHTSDLGVSVYGADAYRERLASFFEQFVGLRYEPEDVLRSGERVVVPYRMSANWRSPEGNRRPFSIRGVFIFTVRSGAISHRVDYWDGMDFARQVRLQEDREGTVTFDPASR